MDTSSNTYLSTISTKLTSRTKEGGRRRRYRLDVVRVGVASGISYAVPLKAKSIERFLAMEKLTLLENTLSYKDTKEEREFLETELKITRNYAPLSNTGSLDNRVRPYECVFIEPEVLALLPKQAKTLYKSTKTVIGQIPSGHDVCAEPLLYTVLRQLGFSNMYVKNFGARHKLSRMHNIFKLLSQLESGVSRQRRLGNCL